MKHVLQVCFFIIMSSPIASAQNEGGVSRGTINIVLANQNGIVILTDSMVTSNGRQLPERPFQKLYKLDDQTVCTIAGFLAAGAAGDIYIDAGAVIREYSRQLGSKPPQKIREKLTSLAFLFRFELSSIATLRAGTGQQTDLEKYKSEITIAGYDTDGVARVGQVTLSAVSRGRFLDFAIECVGAADCITEVGKPLVSKLAGIRDVAGHLLAKPNSVSDDAVLADYALSMRQDQGASLTIPQMRALAARLAAYTAKVQPAVGGENQIAILEHGRLVSLQQQANFPSPPTTPLVRFDLMVDSTFGSPNYSKDSMPSGGSVIFVTKDPLLFLHNTFNHEYRTLDGNYFFDNTFNDCILQYDGDRPFYFDKNNRVQETALFLGPKVKLDDPHVIELRRNFEWHGGGSIPSR
jgi:hypothetical protein